MKAPQRILVPIDQSDYSFIALKYAEDIAEIFKAAVSVLYVEEHDESSKKDNSAAYDRRIEQKTMQKITGLMIEKQIAHTKVSVMVRHGTPAPQIVTVAKEEEIDLIVMSTHGRTGLRHVLMGSVAEQVVRYAPCPVLTMKPVEFREIVSISEDDVSGSLRLG